MYFSMFLILGTIYLLILTVQDYRDMSVDSKYNYILIGLAMSLLTHASRSFWYILVIIGLIVFLNWFGTSIKFFGKGDFSAFNWIIIGFGIISPFLLMAYLVIITVLGFIYHQARRILSKRYLNNKLAPVPFYPVIFGSWIIVVLITII